MKISNVFQEDLQAPGKLKEAKKFDLDVKELPQSNDSKDNKEKGKDKEKDKKESGSGDGDGGVTQGGYDFMSLFI